MDGPTPPANPTWKSETDELFRMLDSLRQQISQAKAEIRYLKGEPDPWLAPEFDAWLEKQR